jgi:DNA-directed RNA polymerase specialized sigma24 family protein
VAAPLTAPELSPSLSLVGELALEHSAHLAWLRRRFPALGAELVADALQTAYADALEQLRLPPERRPRFDSYDAARGWLRTIAGNAARRGVRRSSVVEVAVGDDPEQAPGKATPAADAELLARAEDAHLRESMVRALADLPDDHARVLRWRYLDGLSPDAIMSLEGLDTHGQYEGRHRRAMDALRRSLARVRLGPSCTEARVLLVRRPEAYLDGRRIAAHVDTCVPCQAYGRSLRGALAALPLSPVTLDALTSAVRRTRHEPSGDGVDAQLTGPPAGGAPPSGAAAPSGWRHAAAVKGTAALGAVTFAAGALLLYADDGRDRGDRARASRPAAEAVAPPARPRPDSNLRWARQRPTGAAPLQGAGRTSRLGAGR